MAPSVRFATLAALEEPTLPFEGARLIRYIAPHRLLLHLNRTTSQPKGSQLRKKQVQQLGKNKR